MIQLEQELIKGFGRLTLKESSFVPSKIILVDRQYYYMDLTIGGLKLNEGIELGHCDTYNNRLIIEPECDII
jgi:hypothetical protein